MDRMTLLGVLLVTALPSSLAQENVWTHTGIRDRYRLGIRLAALGDVNGDRYDDVVTMGEVVRAGPRPTFEALFFLSGKDGSLLRILKLPSDLIAFGPVASAGDMDGDGYGDYALGFLVRANQLVVDVRSGRDDRIIWSAARPRTSNFGRSLAGDLDLDGDRRPDLLVGDGIYGARPETMKVYAYSSRGAPLYTVHSTGQFFVGLSVAKVGDVDGDGKDDWVTGGVGACDALGRAILVSGATGKILGVGKGELEGDQIGWSVTGCDDVDGDGAPDFASGNLDFNVSRGVVRVFSGRTAEPLYTLTGTAMQPDRSFGYALAGGADIDQDGVSDLVVGAYDEVVQVSPLKAGAVYVYSGRDRTVLFKAEYRDPNGPSYTAFGGEVATTRARPGTHFPGFVFTNSEHGWGGKILNHEGQVASYQGSPAGVQVFGAACRGTLATFPQIGIRDLGARGARIHLSGGAPGQPAALLVGFSRTRYGQTPLPMFLGGFGFPSCLLFVSIDGVFMTTTGTTGTGRGHAAVDVPFPLANPGSLNVYGQWVSFGAGPTAPGGLSAAITWRH